MAKYIKCSCCSKKIYFGEYVYQEPGRAELFCSAECYAEEHTDVHTLAEEVVYNCWRKVYDTEEEKQKLQRELDEAQRKLTELANQVHTMKTKLHELELVSTAQN